MTAIKNKITPHLWYDKEAMETAKFYTTIFPDSKITNTMTLHNTPSGDTDVYTFELAGQSFMAISAGPLFKFNPSVSFFVNFDPSLDKNAREHLDMLWEKLLKGGTALMPLDKYPFSERYGWVQETDTDFHGSLFYPIPKAKKGPLSFHRSCL